MLNQAVEEKIREIIAETNPEVYVIEIALHRSRRSILSILVDTDQGITLPEVTKLSRAISKYLDESEVLDFAFNLEVSSPGVGAPLRLLRQYVNNVGRNLKVSLENGSEIEGKLTHVDDNLIKLFPSPSKSKKGKKAEGEELKEIEIPLSDIKQAKVLVSFK